MSKSDRRELVVCVGERESKNIKWNEYEKGREVRVGKKE